MTFLPIVQRELRVAARRSVTYWSRLSTAAATAFLAVVMLYSLGLLVSTYRLSVALFQSLVGLVFLYCLFVGARLTADCISLEKRDGTLGLLFLTDLKGYDVTLGKLAAASLNAIYGFLACVPVLGIPLLLGGVTAAQFWRSTLVLLDTLFFSLAAGMLASALSRNQRKAAAAATLLILAVAGGLPLMGTTHVLYLQQHHLPVATSRFGPPSVLVPYLVFSPAFACLAAFDSSYVVVGRLFWVSVAITQALGWLFLALTSGILPRVWQDRPATARIVGWRERLRNWTVGNAARRIQTRARLLAINPVYWLARRHWIKAAYIWPVLLFIAGAWIWGAKQADGAWRELGGGVTLATMACLQTAVKFWAAGEACAPFAEEMRTGTLELLLCTPLSVEEILRGRFRALLRQAAGPAAAVLVAGGLLLWVGGHQLYPFWVWGGSGAERAELIWLCLAGMGMFAADLFTLNWLGMWLGLAATSPRRASGGAALRVLVLPWLIFAALNAAWSFAVWRFHWTYRPGFGVELGLWFAIGLLVDAAFWCWAVNRLSTELRVRAMQRYSPDLTASVWYQLGKRFARWARVRIGHTPPGAG